MIRDTAEMYRNHILILLNVNVDFQHHKESLKE